MFKVQSGIMNLIPWSFELTEEEEREGWMEGGMERGD